ncbi:hypothetical protein JHK84_028125 [Glycine max]|nr:hypothetical protein JHK85_028541 [Glycine max]KAG5151653.1 hypothetical protein JHK84_028125 [Glycine max]
MGSRKPRGPKDLLNMKIVKKSRSKQPIRIVRRGIYCASEIRKQKNHRGSNKKSNESHKSTESREEFVIPGDIPELDSLVVYEKELRSDFFSNVAAGCLEPSRERKKKNSHKSRNKDESHDLVKSITDFVIPGDRLQMCRKLSTVQLTERLDYSNLPGLNPNMKNGRRQAQGPTQARSRKRLFMSGSFGREFGG